MFIFEFAVWLGSGVFVGMPGFSYFFVLGCLCCFTVVFKVLIFGAEGERVFDIILVLCYGGIIRVRFLAGVFRFKVFNFRTKVL